MIDVIDDLFDERYLHNFFPIVTDKIPLTAGNTANREGFPYGDTSTHRLFGSQIFQRENLNRTTVLSPYAQDFFDMFEEIQLRMKEEFYLNIFLLIVSINFVKGLSILMETLIKELLWLC